MSNPDKLNSPARILGLKILGECYSAGRFEALEPLIDERCVFESQWVLEPRTGKAVVMEYLHGKGRALRKSGAFPWFELIELVGDLALSPQQDFLLNDEPVFGSFGLLYEAGKICLLMRQRVQDDIIDIVIDIQLNQLEKIIRIDLCMPELFRYRPWSPKV